MQSTIYRQPAPIGFKRLKWNHALSFVACQYNSFIR
jgi:hypothetical protein